MSSINDFETRIRAVREQAFAIQAEVRGLVRFCPICGSILLKVDVSGGIRVCEQHGDIVVSVHDEVLRLDWSMHFVKPDPESEGPVKEVIEYWMDPEKLEELNSFWYWYTTKNRCAAAFNSSLAGIVTSCDLPEGHQVEHARYVQKNKNILRWSNSGS